MDRAVRGGMTYRAAVWASYPPSARRWWTTVIALIALDISRTLRKAPATGGRRHAG